MASSAGARLEPGANVVGTERRTGEGDRTKAEVHLGPIAPRIPKVLAAVPRQGLAAVDRVARVLRRPAPVVPEPTLKLERRVSALEAELKLERTVTEFLEGEAARLESALDRERARSEELRVRAASLEWQMQEARRTTLKLIAASRASLTMLKKVRLDLVENTFLQEALNPLVHDLREVARAAQELQAFAVFRATKAAPSA